MGRFVDASQNALDTVREVRHEHFPELQGAEIKVLFDTKKRTSGGKLVLGRMKKTNEVERHLSKDQTGSEEGYDYIMYLDQVAWEIAEDEDRVRLVRHEMRHCDVDLDTNGNPYKIKGHDIEDFQTEIRLNQDNLDWGIQLAARVAAEYEAEAQQRRH